MLNECGTQRSLWQGLIALELHTDSRFVSIILSLVETCKIGCLVTFRDLASNYFWNWLFFLDFTLTLFGPVFFAMSSKSFSLRRSRSFVEGLPNFYYFWLPYDCSDTLSLWPLGYLAKSVLILSCSFAGSPFDNDALCSLELSYHELP